MHIRKDGIFDGESFHGNIDMGGGPNSNEEDIATHALVVMVYCIAHYFISGLNGTGN